LRRVSRPQARRAAAISIFFIWNMASVARFAFAASGSVTMSMSSVGTTCQETPNLSLSQPQGCSWPPAVSLSQ